MVWGVVRDGKLVHVGAAGIQDVESKRPVTADTLFRIASMTKAFTALSILRLRDAGALALDAPAETYVPELRGWKYPTGDSPKIRVRDLLTHTGGFRGIASRYDSVPWEQAIAALCDVRPEPMQARDLVGYGASPPDPQWPNGAKIAVSISLNIEGGGEATLANGDPVSEGMLNDIGVPTKPGVRVPLVESVFEYGSRRGAWRVLDILARFKVPVSILGVARAMEQNPTLAKACVDRGHDRATTLW